jgi:beta-lactamase regulating signal transducer with metallopeptidase domain
MEMIFQFLLMNSFYSGLLAIAVLLIKVVIPRLPRNIEYVLWCLVLVRLILPVDFSIAYSLGDLARSLMASEIPVAIQQPDWLAGMLRGELLRTDVLSLTWLELLGFVWLGVASIVAFKFISLKLKLSRLLASAHPVQDDWITKEINFWRRTFSIRRDIIVIDSNDFLSPFTFGVLSPVIFIPHQLLEQKNTEILGPIIAHELAHVKRLDALWLNFQNLIQIAYCLNPVVWLAVRRLNSLREEMCDQRVLNTLNYGNEAYGKSLLHVLRLNIGQKTPELFATFFLSHKKVFKKRIAAIGSNKAGSVKPAIHYACITLFAVFFMPLSWHQTIKAQVDNPQPVLGPESPFPDEIEKDYQPPFLIKSKSGSNDGDIEVEVN